LLDTKWLGGEASIHGDTVHVQMRDDDDHSYELSRLAKGMRSRAFRLQEDIVRQTDVRFVQAVVVFWNKFDAKSVVSEKVAYVHGDYLVEWLKEQRSKMSADRVASVASCITDIRPPQHRAWWNPRSMSDSRGRSKFDSRGRSIFGSRSRSKFDSRGRGTFGSRGRGTFGSRGRSEDQPIQLTPKTSLHPDLPGPAGSG
jgi:hypothetical protein